jgi:hypothetical protein
VPSLTFTTECECNLLLNLSLQTSPSEPNISNLFPKEAELQKGQKGVMKVHDGHLIFSDTLTAKRASFVKTATFSQIL